MSAVFAEYIWVDGTRPTARLRSKTKIFSSSKFNLNFNDFSDWSFDGSSTEQAPGDSSDCILKPVRVFEDPTRGREDGQFNFLVMCEVFEADGKTPHSTNTRAKLREVIGLEHEDLGGYRLEDGDPRLAMLHSWFGLEQEYTLMKGARPLGFPENGFPAPQGPYYCGVGAD